jgi:hypothetical protein
VDDPALDLSLSLYAASKLVAARDVLLCGKTAYWSVRNQLKLFGLEDTEGAKLILGMMSDVSEAAAFDGVSNLERIAPLVSGSAIKFTAVGAGKQGQAQAPAASGNGEP